MEGLMRGIFGRNGKAFSARRFGRRENGFGSRVALERSWRGDQVLVRRRVRPSKSRRSRRFEVAAGMALLGVVMSGGAAASYAVATWLAS
jgi:hypothetical protein